MPTVTDVYERGMTELHKEVLSYDESVRISAPQHYFVVEVADGYVRVECEGEMKEIEPGYFYRFDGLGSDMPDVKLTVTDGQPTVLFTA